MMYKRMYPYELKTDTILLNLGHAASIEPSNICQFDPAHYEKRGCSLVWLDGLQMTGLTCLVQ